MSYNGVKVDKNGNLYLDGKFSSIFIIKQFKCLDNDWPSLIQFINQNPNVKGLNLDSISFK